MVTRYCFNITIGVFSNSFWQLLELKSAHCQCVSLGQSYNINESRWVKSAIAKLPNEAFKGNRLVRETFLLRRET